MWRLALGCLVVLLASAGAAAVAVIEQVHTFVQDISVNKPLKVSETALARSSFGKPETLLMVGDDTRSVFKHYTGGFVPNLANEMLLVRIDPNKPWISMMSLPRELWVNVTEPNGVTYTNRLNSAYTYGTTTLLRTIKHVTGLSVNHVIATTFTQFEAAINRLGCIYDTIDERYYHNNADGGDQYQNIDLQPGYQCLNGNQAEMFVSYRHTDTSQVRDARDQSFLLAVKQQYGPLLSSNISEFEKIFGRTVETDPGLRSSTEILNLADLLINAASLRVRQVPFHTTPCSVTCPSGDLTASPQQVRANVRSFLFGRDITPKRISHKVTRRAHGSLSTTLAVNVVAERAAAHRLPFTAEFPKVQDTAGTAIPIGAECAQVTGACIRNYTIRAPNGTTYPIYVEAFSNGDLGQYYDVQGTTWTGAPLVARPTQTLRVGRRLYELFYGGSHLETVAWRQHGAVYWVRNTLTNSVSAAELLAIAEQTAPVAAVRAAHRQRVVKVSALPAHQLPTPTIQAKPNRTPLIESVGRIGGGLITLLLLPLGLLLFLRERRRFRALRDHVSAATARADALEAQLGVSPGLGGASPGPSGGDAATRRRLQLTPISVSLGVAVAVAIALGVYLAVGTDVLGQRTKTRTVTTASVAVRNAGHAPGAAHRLARMLSGRRFLVVAVGRLTASRPDSYQVLYVAGDARQARLLAAMLRPRRAVVARMNAATARTIRSRPRLIVVIP